MHSLQLIAEVAAAGEERSGHLGESNWELRLRVADYGTYADLSIDDLRFWAQAEGRVGGPYEIKHYSDYRLPTPEEAEEIAKADRAREEARVRRQAKPPKMSFGTIDFKIRMTEIVRYTDPTGKRCDSYDPGAEEASRGWSVRVEGRGFHERLRWSPRKSRDEFAAEEFSLLRGTLSEWAVDRLVATMGEVLPESTGYRVEYFGFCTAPLLKKVATALKHAFLEAISSPEAVAQHEFRVEEYGGIEIKPLPHRLRAKYREGEAGGSGGEVDWSLLGEVNGGE